MLSQKNSGAAQRKYLFDNDERKSRQSTKSAMTQIMRTQPHPTSSYNIYSQLTQDNIERYQQTHGAFNKRPDSTDTNGVTHQSNSSSTQDQSFSQRLQPQRQTQELGYDGLYGPNASFIQEESEYYNGYSSYPTRDTLPNSIHPPYSKLPPHLWNRHPANRPFTKSLMPAIMDRRIVTQPLSDSLQQYRSSPKPKLPEGRKHDCFECKLGFNGNRQRPSSLC